ncbi:MAG TPA: HRDC domain-containing protein, partial [Anaerolineae bacterium]|nr:HRDC domain-containing protein [Anaerolineae bacterium]
MAQPATYPNSISSKQPVWIDSRLKLDQLIRDLSVETLVAVDTESDSLYSYFEKVCLIQFSTARVDYLVDPLNVDVSALAPLFASPAIQKIFHAAEYDLLSLKRDYNFTFTNLFDTMLAARILGWPRYGLGPILEEYFGVKLDKRFQRHDWSQRPLSQQALDYARLDTHFLLALREIQLDQLKRQNRLQEALEAFERQTQVQPTPKVFDPNDFWRIKGSKDLEPQQQAILRELFMMRDKIARKIDRPPFKVMNDSTLTQLAKEQPSSEKALRETKGLGPRLLRHNSQHILRAIQEGQMAPPPQHPANHHRPDEDTLIRYEALRQWRNTLAAERGVEPDVIISNSILMDIARRNPKTLGMLIKMGVLGNWQFETYGQTLL